MNCPKCDSPKVVKRRRYRCLSCGFRWDVEDLDSLMEEEARNARIWARIMKGMKGDEDEGEAA